MKKNTLFLFGFAMPKICWQKQLLFYFFSCLFIPIINGQNTLCPEESGRFAFETLMAVDNEYRVGIVDSVSTDVIDNSAFLNSVDNNGTTLFITEVFTGDDFFNTLIPYTLNSDSIKCIIVEKKDNGQIYFHINDSTHTDPSWVLRNDVAYFPRIISPSSNAVFRFSPEKSTGLNMSCADTDMDGIIDEEDNCPNMSNSNQEDTDEDGTGDVCDLCPTNPEKIDPGVCGCDINDFFPDIIQTDSTLLLREELLVLSESFANQIKNVTLEASDAILFQPGFTYKPDSTIGGSLIAQIKPITTDSNLVMTVDTTICKGESVRLDAVGNFENYEWDIGANAASVMVAPMTTRTYEVMNIDSNGCMQKDEVRIEVADDTNSDCPTCIGVAAQMNATLCGNSTQSVKYKETEFEYYEVLGDTKTSDLHPFDLINGKPKRTEKLVEKYFNVTDKVTKVISYINPEEIVNSWRDKPATVVQSINGIELYGCNGGMLNSIAYDAEIVRLEHIWI